MDKQEFFTITLEELIDILEERSLGWSIQHLNKEVQARVYDTNDQCISRYVAHNKFESLAFMLAEAMYQVDWTLYPEKK